MFLYFVTSLIKLIVWLKVFHKQKGRLRRGWVGGRDLKGFARFHFDCTNYFLKI